MDKKSLSVRLSVTLRYNVNMYHRELRGGVEEEEERHEELRGVGGTHTAQQGEAQAVATHLS